MVIPVTVAIAIRGCMLSLLNIKGFVAFIAIAFINAFIDLGHKIIVQNTLFKVYDGPEQVILTAVVNGLILLPFILLLSPAGYLSDRFAKPQVMRWSARVAVLITLLITLSYYQGWFEVAFAMTLLLAMQSALYSPAKYGFIRDLVGADKLSEGNGWVQSATMIAILSGIVVFSLLFETLLSGIDISRYGPADILQSIAPLGWVLVVASIIEALLTQQLPNQGPNQRPNQHDSQAEVAFNWSAYAKAQLLKQNLSVIWHDKTIIQSIFGLSIFWTVSQVMLAVYPSFAETALGEVNTFVIQGAMALAGIGIMLGSVLAAKFSRHHINRRLIPLGAAGVTLGLFLLPLLDSLMWAAADFFLIGASGALMIIPLNALIQLHAPDDHMGKVLAGNNFVQNISMLCGLILTVIFSLLQWSESWLLYGLTVMAIVGTLLAIRMLPGGLQSLKIKA
jgi:acyl-[acyl-carrier-protein]-phospholipid O-acyltransferase/long-chain-fatty-acid--[acyl-carrier-protein] ligase